jgi:hypothetical protein
LQETLGEAIAQTEFSGAEEVKNIAKCVLKLQEHKYKLTQGMVKSKVYEESTYA